MTPLFIPIVNKPQNHLMRSIKYLILIITLFFSCSIAASVDEVPILCSSLQRSLPALVIVPTSYPGSQHKFPVIYLLHGYSGNCTIFSQIVNLKKYADSFTVIFVCPDGNYDSWYLNSPLQKKSQFETYIIKDVIGYVDTHYRTIASVKGRAIIGSSMGGHGALTLLALHPEMFAGAGSISGILDLTAFPGNWDIRDVLGDFSSNKETWENHSFITLMNNLVNKGKGIIIDCGTSDFALDVNRAAHAKLNSLSIVHQYTEQPGDHSYRFVQKVFIGQIAYCVATFK